jgi:chemosensory pili system protein ChpC
MTEQAAQFVHCMLIPLSQHYLLLPNSSISEVIPKTGVRTETNTQSWLDVIEWQQQRIPVVHLEHLLNDEAAPLSSTNKLCIINGINSEAGISSYAIPCSGSPQLITLNQAALHLTHDDNNSPYLHCQIKISNKVALIPNLDALEHAIKLEQA